MASQQMPPMAVKVDFNQGQLDPSNLKGRSVLVTGAASGIGRACAATIAGTGALVTLADRNDAEGEAIVQDMISRGYRVQFVRCDVSSYTEQVAMFQKAVQFGGGKLDIVIPNAGILGGSNLFDLLSADAPTLDGPPPPEPSFVGCEVNLHSVYNSCFLAAHYFRVARETQDTFKPSIVLISSLAGYVGYPSDSNYSMSKFGVRGLFYSLRDRATHAIRINLVAPWIIDTPMTRAPEFVNSEAATLSKYTGFAPMERVLDAVLRFCSDERLHGRAAGIFPLANEDLGDDLEGSFGGTVVHKHMSVVAQMIVKGMAADAQGDGAHGKTT